MVSQTDLYVFSLDTFVAMALRPPLDEAHHRYGDIKKVAKALKCRPERLQAILNHPVPVSLPGPKLLELSLGDIQGKSLPRVIHEIEEACIPSKNLFGSQRMFADVLDTTEWDLRRIIRRAENKRREQVSRQNESQQDQVEDHPPKG